MAAGSSAITDNDGWQDYKPQHGDDGWQDYQPAQSPVQQALASVPKPKVNMKSSLLGQAVYGPVDNEDEGSLRGAGYAGPAPSQINPKTSSAAMVAAATGGAAMAGAGGARLLSPVARPIARVAAKHPIWTSLAIGEARHLPYVGKYIPPYADLAPFFLKGEHPAEIEAAPEQPPIEAPASAPKPGYEPIQNPERKLRDQIDQLTGNKLPTPLKYDVPLRKQLPALQAKPAAAEGYTPVESSAMRSYRYDPEAHELAIEDNRGTVHIYGDVNKEDAEAFANAESKGKAWNSTVKNNPRVAKVINGKRVASKRITVPEMAAPGESNEGDLTSLLQKSVKQARKKKAEAQ